MKRFTVISLFVLIVCNFVFAGVRLNEHTVIEFANIEQGQKILGAKDDYYDHLSKFDLQAKIQTGDNVARKDYLENARDAVIEWSDEQKKRMIPVLEQISKDLEFVKWDWPETVYLINTDGSEEGGAAYTRGKGVVLPGGRNGKSLVTHELFHVLSRHNPVMRDAVYGVIGFKKCNEIKMPASLTDYTIANPDAPRNQHYIEVTYEGKDVCAVPFIYSSRGDYDAERGGSFMRYMESDLLIVAKADGEKDFKPVIKDGKPVIVDFEEVEGFYEKIGRNTGYIIHPEEVLASNFPMIPSDRKAPSPEILAGIKNVLMNNPMIDKTKAGKVIALPKPQTDGSKPLMQVLSERKSCREYSDKQLSKQTLSNLLWAAFGINREEGGKRTAPSAMNWQEIDIYVAMADGLYVYEAKGHSLRQILMDDVREATGMQEFVKDAAVNLVYVADYSKMGDASESDKATYSAADTGFIGQNVYLFSASEGLGTVVRGLVDREKLSEIIKLKADQRIVLCQTVGYPKK